MAWLLPLAVLLVACAVLLPLRGPWPQALAGVAAVLAGVDLVLALS